MYTTYTLRYFANYNILIYSSVVSVFAAAVFSGVGSNMPSVFLNLMCINTMKKSPTTAIAIETICETAIPL